MNRRLTLAQLYRDAEAGLWLNMTYRYGEKIPERLSGWRKVIGHGSKCLYLLSEGRKSALTIKNAVLTEYTGTQLSIYDKGVRKLNEHEMETLKKWESHYRKKGYEELDWMAALSDGCGTYWIRRAFFREAGVEYLVSELAGDSGLRLVYDENEEKLISDPKIRGNLVFSYQVHKGRF